MITRVEAMRYRCFERLGVDTSAYQVVVGANGSGKSTLLDAPVLIGDLLGQRQVSDAFLVSQRSRNPRATTLAELVYFGRGLDFILAVEARLPEGIADQLLEGRGRDGARLDHLRYEMRLRIADGRALVVDSEHLIAFEMTQDYRANRLPLQGDNTRERGWLRILKRARGGPAEFTRETARRSKSQVAVDESLLALPRVLFESADDFPAARWLNDLLVQDAVFFSPSWEGLRTASPPGRSTALMGSGENLPWLALALKQADPERYQDWVAHIAEALPIAAIDVREREDDHHAYFVVQYQTGLTATSSGLSEGTLRLMAYTLLPYLPNPPALVLVEEPENGIHPRAIETALQSLESMYDGQVWVASHSPVVLAHTELDHILCARLSDEGSAEVISGRNHPRLAHWQGTIDLGSLFAAGVLG